MGERVEAQRMSDSVIHITSYSTHPEDGHIEYTIHIRDENHVRRRFREFIQLREEIVEHWDGAPPLPSKLFDTSPTSRLPHLDKFLSQICETLGPKPPVALLRFLQVDVE